MLLLDIKEMAMFMIIAIAIVGCFVLFALKHTKAAVELLLMVVLVTMFFVSIAYGEEDFVDVVGDVIEEPLVIDNVEYEVKEVETGIWIIPVDTEYGIICFYSDCPIQGRVYMLCFGEDFEVIDVIVFDELEKPFREEPSSSLPFLFFYSKRVVEPEIKKGGISHEEPLHLSL